MSNRRSIFVFGSNLKGAHGAGAAKYARLHHGAIYGQGIGLQGNSYAIPTKDQHLRTLPLEHIAQSVALFLEFARERVELDFQVTQIGCGLAKLDCNAMASLFSDAPSNCLFDEQWRPYLDNSKNYWGTFG